MNVLVSACLLGVGCRYDGAGKPMPRLAQLLAAPVHLVPFCPEIYGGLPTPRVPAERKNGGVWTRDGRDVTAAYQRGAQEALRLCRLMGCTHALLKERSPSCGCGAIYDGSFTGTLIPGRGVTAELLQDNGITVWGESALGDLLAAAAEEGSP